MTWVFATEPGFESKLAWMREFMVDRVLPLETLDLDVAEIDELLVDIQAEVKKEGLWAAHLDPELGGQGYGQVNLGLMHEIIGRSTYGPLAFGCQPPDSGNSEILARHGTEDQKERWLWPLLDGRIKSCFGMTEPGAGADPTLLSALAVRDFEAGKFGHLV